MTKDEMALQLTLKAMELNKIPYTTPAHFTDVPKDIVVTSVEKSIDFNANAVARYYNYLMSVMDTSK